MGRFRYQRFRRRVHHLLACCVRGETTSSDSGVSPETDMATSPVVNVPGLDTIPTATVNDGIATTSSMEMDADSDDDTMSIVNAFVTGLLERVIDSVVTGKEEIHEAVNGVVQNLESDSDVPREAHSPSGSSPVAVAVNVPHSDTITTDTVDDSTPTSSVESSADSDDDMSMINTFVTRLLERTIDCVVSERKQTDSGVPSENQNITGATVNDGVSSIIGSVDYPVADLEESVMYEEQETETEETEVVDSYSSVHNSNAMESMVSDVAIVKSVEQGIVEKEEDVDMEDVVEVEVQERSVIDIVPFESEEQKLPTQQTAVHIVIQRASESDKLESTDCANGSSVTDSGYGISVASTSIIEGEREEAVETVIAEQLGSDKGLRHVASDELTNDTAIQRQLSQCGAAAMTEAVLSPTEEHCGDLKTQLNNECLQCGEEKDSGKSETSVCNVKQPNRHEKKNLKASGKNPNPIFEATLVCGPLGLGLTFGDDEMRELIVIKRIMMFSPAYMHGKLRVGDCVVEVNGCEVIGMSPAQLQRQMSKVKWGEEVKMLIIPAQELMVFHESSRGNGGIITMKVDTAFNRPLGIDIEGGSDTECPYIRIAAITPGSLADKCKLLRAGDELVKVNDHLMVGATHFEAIDILGTLYKPMILTVQRRSNLNLVERIIDRRRTD